MTENKTFNVPQETMKNWLCELIAGADITGVELHEGLLEFTLGTLLGEIAVILPADAAVQLLFSAEGT